MKRIFIVLAIVLVLAFTGCEAVERSVKDFGSSITGLDRVVTVYSDTGEILKTYSGKIDVEGNEYGNKVKFDLGDQRIIIYNAIVIVEEKD